MDQDTIRLMIFAAGVVLVVAIFAWDRYRRIQRQIPRLHHGRVRRVPRIAETRVATEPQVGSDSDDDVEELFRPPSNRADEPFGPEPGETEAKTPGQSPEELEISAYSTTDYLHSDPDQEGLPELILQINVKRSEGTIPGENLVEAAAQVDLRAGAMNIYHRHDAMRPEMVLFSMASMVEPGSFPFEHMEEFVTPGVTLFTRLPGLRDGMIIYSDMLFTAQRLATILDAELQDDTHSVLTKQTIEHTRERILEHKHRLRLARKRV